MCAKFRVRQRQFLEYYLYEGMFQVLHQHMATAEARVVESTTRRTLIDACRRCSLQQTNRKVTNNGK